MRESHVEKQVKEWAKRNGILAKKNLAGGEVGWPDDYFLHTWPAIAFVEFKQPGKKPSPIQVRRIAELQRRGYPAKVIDNVDDGIAFLAAALLSGKSS